ncbi:hypothetical protein C8R43DRAFT_999813 [Mycena crocata]|nr:hypothetical protein C8R43DRAFT_999813 [Mycena crocata]
MVSLNLWTTYILAMANMVLLTFAMPVDSFVPPPLLNLGIRDITNTTTHFVHSWGPSIFLDWVDHVAYPNTNHTKPELCQKIGSQLEPLAHNFWKDFGASTKVLAGVAPFIAEATVKYSRGDAS